MQPTDYAKLLRENVKARVNAKRGVQAGLARAMGIEDPAVSKWLNGEHNPGMDKLGAIAAFFKCPLADLFIPVNELGDRDLPSQPAARSYSSNAPLGDTDGTDSRLLRSRIAALETENAQLRLSLDAIADELKKLAAVVKARKTARGKPSAR